MDVQLCCGPLRKRVPVHHHLDPHFRLTLLYVATQLNLTCHVGLAALHQALKRCLVLCLTSYMEGIIERGWDASRLNMTVRGPCYGRRGSRRKIDFDVFLVDIRVVALVFFQCLLSSFINLSVSC